MHGSRLSMTRKHWIATNLVNQAKGEDYETSERMLAVANHLRKCGSTTLWDLANRGYEHRLSLNKPAKKPEVEEYFEWRGEKSEDGKLANLGLVRCERIQCPVCCYSRTILRRDLALEWSRTKDWSEYYGVMLTFTVSHRLSDSETSASFEVVLGSLDTSLKRFASWFRDISKTKKVGYKSLCPDSLGYISSLEFTFGRNGLHPHFHTIFLTKSSEDVDRLREFFRKDRVRIWTESGHSLSRMPNFNEDESFKIFLVPGNETPAEKVMSYVSKGLFETLSSVTKERQSGEGSKSIFQLSGHELKYFCTFFESTKGKRFYRSGGICKEIPSVSDALENNDLDEKRRSKFETIVRIADKPEGWVTEFVKSHRREIDQICPNLGSQSIGTSMVQSWNDFVEKKSKQLLVSGF
jgi:hypothetical protein